jgi:SAM-dependent methyltransferase
MQLYKYTSYGEYKKAQIDYNVLKQDLVWAKRTIIKSVAGYLKRFEPKLGMCHGVRNGAEMKMFEKYLPGCQVHGTEISYTAENLKNVFIWDFHEVHDQWLDTYDFIYSNSLDHAYNPAKAVRAWGRCIKSGGHIIIEHTRNHMDSTVHDPFGVRYDEFKPLLSEWLGKKFSVEYVKKYMDIRKTKLIYIRKK